MLEDIWVTLSELDNVTFSFKQLDENCVASESFLPPPLRESGFWGGRGCSGVTLPLPLPPGQLPRVDLGPSAFKPPAPNICGRRGSRFI